MVTRRQTGVLRILACVALILSLLTFNAAVSPGVARVTVATAAPLSFDTATRARVNATYGRLPLYFEANEGQTDPQVKFLARGAGQALFLTSTEAVLVLTKADPQAQSSPRPLISPVATRAGTQTVLRMTFVGASPQPRITGQRELTGKVNYFLGNDPVKWRTNVPTYAAVRYEGLYPGIDLVYYGNNRQLEYDLVVTPGADPSQIGLNFGGTDRLEVDAQGDLVLHSAVGPIRQRKPLIHQEVGGRQVAIPGGYVLRGAHRVGFQVAAYDASRPLVIDPVVVYSTYLGGTAWDEGKGIAVDGQGNAYVVGMTFSTGSTSGSPGSCSKPDADIFVTKLNPTGSAIVYTTYLAGSGGDIGTAIAVDGQGSAYVTGETCSTNFPTTPGAFASASSGSADAFVTKLNPAGSALVYSTYLGGSGVDLGTGIAVDAQGNAVVTGGTSSSNFPTVNAVQPAFRGSAGDPGGFQPAGWGDAFLTKLTADGSTAIYSTYLGGSGLDEGRGIAVDAAGAAYVVGTTSSLDFPTVNPLQPSLRGNMVFQTQDGGTSWAASDTGLPTRTILSLAIDPKVPTTLYAGTSGLGVYKTVDGGSHWAQTGLTNGLVYALAVDPVNPSILYAGGQLGVPGFGTRRNAFKSIDGGGTWTPLDIFSCCAVVTDFAIVSSTPTVLFAGTTQGVFKSMDGGQSWVATNGFNVTAVAVDPLIPLFVYASTYEYGIQKSVDGGMTWQRVQQPSFENAYDLIIDPKVTTTLYASAYFWSYSNGRYIFGGGVFKSVDGGLTWTNTSLGLLPQRLAIDPLTSTTLYAAAGDLVFKSTDGGASWAVASAGLGSAGVMSLAIDPSRPSTIFAGTTAGGYDVFVAKVDPVGSTLIYSTYLGGRSNDMGTAIAVDAEGSAYVTGRTTSRDFPTTAGAFDTACGLNGSCGYPSQVMTGDGFVSKLSPTGSVLVYSTFLRGSREDTPAGIAVGAGGNVYVTGDTSSPDFPVVNAIQSTFKGEAALGYGSYPEDSGNWWRTDWRGDAFVTVLSADGSALLYSTYLGGTYADVGNGIAIDAAGNAYVTGLTTSPDFPSANSQPHTWSNAFVVEISSP